jgi:malonyl-CoA O-methyltransferase
MDLAPGMISFARHKSPTSPFVIADMDALPLRPEACALVYSSLAVQWSSNLAGVLDSVYRTLVPGGLFMFSTLLDGTLKELAQAWRAADNYQHVNAFTTAAALTSALAGSGFEDSNVQYQQVVLQYSDVRELTGELKKLGAHNSNRQRSQGMTGKAALRAFKLAYESCRENGLLPATYEVAYVYLRKSR